MANDIFDDSLWSTAFATTLSAEFFGTQFKPIKPYLSSFLTNRVIQVTVGNNFAKPNWTSLGVVAVQTGIADELTTFDSYFLKLDEPRLIILPFPVPNYKLRFSFRPWHEQAVIVVNKYTGVYP
jgi:hypothetical protein